MALRSVPLPSAVPLPAGTVIAVDFAARAAADRTEGAYRAEGGFPFALLAAGLAGGVALGVAAAVLGAPGWAAGLVGWFGSVALVPVLPFAPVIGRAFWNDEPPAPRGGGGEVVTLPLARDLSAWDADLAAEASHRAAG